MNSDQSFQMLFQQLWQIVAVTMVVWVLAQMVGRKRPHLAHGLWLIVVLKCVTPPIWGYSLGVFSQVQAVLAANDVAASINAGAPMDAGSPDDVALSSETIATLSRGKLIDESEMDFGAFAPQISGRPTGVVPRQRIGTTLWSVLAAGAMLGFLVVGVKFATCVRRIKKNRVRDFDDELNEHVARLCRQLRIRHVPEIIVSDVLFGPAVLGIFRHTIVLPKCLLQTETAEQTVTPESLNPILVHELLHIRRGDLFTGALQAVVQCLWWFHPAVWFANRMLSRDAERCCDEQVIAELGCGPAEYARSLLSVIESKRPLQAVPVFPGMKPVEMTSQRMERIMSLKNGCQKRMPLWNWAIVLGFGLLVLPGAASQNSETTTTSPPSGHALQQTETPAANSSEVSSPQAKSIAVATTSDSVQQQPKTHASETSAVSKESAPLIIGQLTTVRTNVERARLLRGGDVGTANKVNTVATSSLPELLRMSVDTNQRDSVGKVQFVMDAEAASSESLVYSYKDADGITVTCRSGPTTMIDKLTVQIQIGPGSVASSLKTDQSVVFDVTDQASAEFEREGQVWPADRVLMMVFSFKTVPRQKSEVSVIGAVRKPGTYNLRTASNVADAIAVAGGLTTKTGNRVVIRRVVSHPGAERAVLAVDLQGTGATARKNLLLSPGDVLVVTPLPVNALKPAAVPETAGAQQRPGQTGKLSFGSGVNSDAGVVGNLVIPQDTFEKQLGFGTDQLPQPERKLFTMVYNVADLVVPIQKVVGKPEGTGSGVVQVNGSAATKFTKERPLPAPLRMQPAAHNGRSALSIYEVDVDFAPLVELIRTSVTTDAWARENGPARIITHSRNLSIVIRQTAEAHDEIADLLSALRKEHHLVVVAEVRIVQLPENQASDWLDKAIELNTSADGLRWALSTESRIETLLEYVSAGGGQMILTPKIMTLPGHTAEISVSGGDQEGQPSGITLSLTARPLSEGNLLRLDYRIGINEPLKDGGAGTGLLKSGQTLVIEYAAGSGVPMLGNVPYVNRLFRNLPDNSGRYLITITPRLVRTVVEHELPKSEL